MKNETHLKIKWEASKTIMSDSYWLTSSKENEFQKMGGKLFMNNVSSEEINGVVYWLIMSNY